MAWTAGICLQAAELPSAARVETLSTNATMSIDRATGEITLSGGARVVYEDGSVIANRITVNQVTGAVVADGAVQVERSGQLWSSERLEYNYKTHTIQGDLFRAGRSPLFMSGQRLTSDTEGKRYSAENAIITGDDYSTPAYSVRARKITVVPGEYVKAEGAYLQVGSASVFYMPVWRRSLRRHTNYWVETPGYRSRYGPYLLSSYHHSFSDKVEGVIDIDYRQKRGFGYGPELKYDLNEKWGRGEVKYYRAQDENPGLDLLGRAVPDERQRVWFEHQAQMATNLTFRAAVRYQSDPLFIRDYFEPEYVDNVQPSTFAEIQKSWDNWSLNALTQVRVNDYHDAVDRLPDLKLTGLRQQVGNTPVFYESESSAGYFRRLYGDAASPTYAAFRGDSLHQLFYPKTFFNFLNFTPRVGSRLTYYSEVDGRNSILSERERFVFNTGAELSTKASRVWKGTSNKFFDLDGLRHILEPSLNYVYVPSPTRGPRELAQFDYEFPSRRLLPIDYPDYNAIDSVDSQNVLRLGLRNKLQTRRGGQVEDFISWALYTDWRLNPTRGQGTFADLYSDLDFAPARWLRFASEVRYDMNDGDWREVNHLVTFLPNNVWSLSVGHRYLRDEPSLGVDSGNNLITTRFYYRLSENWGFRTTHHFEARDGTLEDQAYSFYRDFRSWTSVLTFRVREGRTGQPADYRIAVIFNFKAFPRYSSGSDVNSHSSVLGF